MSNILLEPRLQEYINKKAFYKKLGTEPKVSLEKILNITEKDKKMIKAYQTGNKNEMNSLVKNTGIETQTQSHQFWADICKDERIEKLKKQQTTREGLTTNLYMENIAQVRNSEQEKNLRPVVSQKKKFFDTFEHNFYYVDKQNLSNQETFEFPQMTRRKTQNTTRKYEREIF